MSIIRFYEDAKGWGLPSGLIPFDGDGHWWLCFDYRQRPRSREPQIMHVDLELSGEFVVAKSFDRLLRGLIRADRDYIFAVIDRKLDQPKLDTLFKSVGYSKSKHRASQLLENRKYRSDIIRGDPASIFLNMNSGGPHNLQFPQLPGSTRLLYVDVCEKDQVKCITELSAALGPSAILVHQAPDRKPIKLPAIPAKRTR